MSWWKRILGVAQEAATQAAVEEVAAVAAKAGVEVEIKKPAQGYICPRCGARMVISE